MKVVSFCLIASWLERLLASLTILVALAVGGPPIGSGRGHKNFRARCARAIYYPLKYGTTISKILHPRLLLVSGAHRDKPMLGRRETSRLQLALQTVALL